jgi:hypothetical protein
MGVASRVADYAQIPALHEGRGMVAGRKINVRPADGVPALGGKSHVCKVVAVALRGARVSGNGLGLFGVLKKTRDRKGIA